MPRAINYLDHEFIYLNNGLGLDKLCLVRSTMLVLALRSHMLYTKPFKLLIIINHIKLALRNKIEITLSKDFDQTSNI